MSSFLLEQYENTARYFFLRFFGVDIDNLNVDDETTIFDILEFSKDIIKRNEEVKILKKEIETEYHIDISDLEELKLVDLFKRIELLK